MSMGLGRVALAGAALLAGVCASHAQNFVFDQYSVQRASPAATYFTPGSITYGYTYKGVLKIESVCRNAINIDTDEALLRAPLQSGGFTSQKGWQFDIGVNAVNVLNATVGGNFVTDVAMTVDNVTIYEYSAEDLHDVRHKLLARPGCAAALKNRRYRNQTVNDQPAGLFEIQRFAVGDVTYQVNFNKDNPKALSATVQATVTKDLQVKFGLTNLSQSGSTLTGKRIVVGINPIWRVQWD